MKLLLGLAALAVATVAPAQSISKCKDKRGNVYYSQTGCASSQREVGNYRFTPEVPARRTYQTPQGNAYQDDYGSQNEPVRSSGYGGSNGAGLIGQSDQTSAATTRPYLERTAPVRRNRSRDMPQVTVPNDGVGLPTQVLNPYNGRVINGIKTSPDQVWDPQTNRYYHTDR